MTKLSNPPFKNSLNTKKHNFIYSFTAFPAARVGLPVTNSRRRRACGMALAFELSAVDYRNDEWRASLRVGEEVGTFEQLL